MREIPTRDLAGQLVRLLPEVEPYLETAARRHGRRASRVTHWDQVNTHPGTLLSEVLAHPLFQPRMEPAETDVADEEFLDRAFRFAGPRTRAEILPYRSIRRRTAFARRARPTSWRR
ncbi:hypothetical protein [Streptomyces sp. NPDC059814]|uniref:hypothetical protein n=1 Tax=Streptomyces sp. NPDC059814 TaxID=3346959 RepID=UPI00365516CA